MRTGLLLFMAAGLVLAADPNWIGDAGGVMVRDAQGRITQIDLRSSWVTDSDLREIARMPALTHLDLSLTRISDLGLRELKPAPKIAELNLYYAEYVTDEGLAAVKEWKHLKRLNLRGTKITDTTLEHLSGVASLESLDIGFAQVTDNGLDRLTLLPNLKELTIGGNKMTDVGLQSLRQMTGLTYLDVSGMQRTDSGMWSMSLTEPGLEAIATLKSLRELRIGGTTVSARGLGTIATLPRLERLHLQDAKRVADDAIETLASFPALLMVDLKGTAITEKGVAELRRLKPDCQILY